MQWRVTDSEAADRERIRNTIKYQKNHDTYFVYEKRTGQAIGFAGVEQITPDIYQEASIALGPEYTGQGYGLGIVHLKPLRSPAYFLTSIQNRKLTCETGISMSWKSIAKNCKGGSIIAGNK